MHVLIIDGLNFVRRIFSAVPNSSPENSLISAEHQQTVIHSVLSAASRAINSHQVSHAVIVFETAGPNWRYDIFPHYKADRKPQPRALLELLPKLETALLKANLHSIEAEGFEADDTIASIATRLGQQKIPTTVLSSDHLLCQLTQENVRIFDHFQNKALDNAFIRARYGIDPSQLPDFFALAGQSSVSIPGVKGIGVKTASELLQQHSDIETLLHHLDELKASTAQKLATSNTALYQFKHLFTLRQDVKINSNLKQWRLHQ